MTGEDPRRPGRRVLHVSMPTTEGVARVALGHLRDQVDRGWQVTLACPHEGWLADEAVASGAAYAPWEATRDPGPGTLAEVRRLGAVVERVGPDVVHLHSAKAGLAGRLLLRGRVTTVYQPHGWSFHAAQGAVGTAARRWETFASRWTDLLVCVSEDELRIGREAGTDARALVLPNGVDPDAFPLAPEPAEARAALSLPAAPTAVCLGRLSRQKGQDRLLDIWGEVRSQVPDARLLLVGDGPEREPLAARAGEGVIVVGNQAEPAPWLAAADVVVVASRWEGMALAPLEAMATGRCVVGYDVSGLREAVPAGVGAVVPQDRPDLLVDELAARLGDPVRSLEEGRAGRRHVLAHHDARVAAGRLAQAYG